MNTQSEYLTKEKFDELTHELEELKHTKRKQVAENLESAKSLGDLSENAEYQEAREMQATIEDRIRKIETILQDAKIVSFHHTDKVEIGSTVTVRKVGDKTTKVWKIVGSEETNMAQGKLSNRSPFGTALMGKKKGDEVSFKSPTGVIQYTVVSIE
ncbi:MAG: transcription elongation factor GreA [Patescibacteria group bacterium]